MPRMIPRRIKDRIGHISITNNPCRPALPLHIIQDVSESLNAMCQNDIITVVQIPILWDSSRPYNICQKKVR